MSLKNFVLSTLLSGGTAASVCEPNLSGAANPRPRRHLDLSVEDELVDARLLRPLNQRMIAQPQIITALSGPLYRARTNAIRRGPLGAVLLYGPTGVGKNLTGEILAELVGGRLIEIEGGDFQTEGSVTGLTGASPSWVGHGTTKPMITPAILEGALGKTLPVSVILINEIDKAHIDFIDWWLKGLDVGYNTVWLPKPSTDKNEKASERVTIDLTRTIIIGTTNAGANVVKRLADQIIRSTKLVDPELLDRALGVGDLLIEHPPNPAFDADARAELNQTFKRPEFLGRFDELVPAWPLLRAGLERVVEMEVRRVGRGAAMPTTVRLTPAAKRLIIDSSDLTYGARGISRVVDGVVSAPLSKLIATEQIKAGDLVVGARAGQDDNCLEFFARASRKPPPETTDAATLAELDEIINSGEPEIERLKKFEDLAYKVDRLSAATALALLRAVPKGLNWGRVPENEPRIFRTLFEAHGLGPFNQARGFTGLDLSVIFVTLNRLSGPISPAQLNELRDEALSILEKTTSATGNNKLEPSTLARLPVLAQILLERAVSAAPRVNHSPIYVGR